MDAKSVMKLYLSHTLCGNNVAYNCLQLIAINPQKVYFILQTVHFSVWASNDIIAKQNLPHKSFSNLLYYFNEG